MAIPGRSCRCARSPDYSGGDHWTINQNPCDALYNNTVPLILDVPRPAESGGGGGGGRKALLLRRRASCLVAPISRSFPPMVEPKNLAPELVVETTVIAPQLANVQPLDLQIGDPNGLSGPLSAGPGTGGGIGTGIGTGVGPGRGGGVGPGEGGGIGGGVFSVGGGVSEPGFFHRSSPNTPTMDARLGFREQWNC